MNSPNELFQLRRRALDRRSADPYYDRHKTNLPAGTQHSKSVTSPPEISASDPYYDVYGFPREEYLPASQRHEQREESSR